MDGKVLTISQTNKIHVGEAITLAAVLAILATAIVAVAVYKMFKSSKGSLKLPGGYGFEWK